MTKRFALSAVLITAIALWTSCPWGSSSPLIGTWIMDRGTAHVGIEMKANGETEVFAIPPSTQTLSGVITWEVNGTEITMRHVSDSGTAIYAGRITDNTSIEGYYIIWEGVFHGSYGEWTQVKAN